MLILRRKTGETIVINKDIHITISKITVDGVNVNGSLELEIDAPRHVPVDRLEIHNLKNNLLGDFISKRA